MGRAVVGIGVKSDTDRFALQRRFTMSAAPLSLSNIEVDLIEEMRLRAWARRNYCSPESRSSEWHPVVHEEMRRKEVEEHC